ncbi:DotI/IcmL family type IV secretion protein [Legionella jamestowniensis]|uniref:IcmL-like protein n=1 Tax=Legionella jamestowniensis TaxID=455 RepID=A0A0W0UZH6_9GAMM|nr:DotI/IcmL family type IV secretion protein [Legionella jamestowniensis]KTD13255.1 IcmL-like protein [Legionella jamestowniensis]SFL78026.1 Macrophage killing protein with similarity to conjugation protein [Legionella jamestowniensis DSM 19215]
MKNRMLCSIILSFICTQLLAQIENSTLLQQPRSSQHKNIACPSNIITETPEIDDAFILDWVTHAATQSFHFTPEAVDTQLQQLQACYTPQGWNELNKAFYKSGNIELIKTQHLAVLSELDGPAQLIEAKEDLWKITVPLRVIYQNDQERITHFLNVYFTVGRKLRGELGIMQMIAIPRATPSFQKAGSLKETAKGVYNLLAERNVEAHNALQEKIISPFFSSLFPNPTRLLANTYEDKEKASLVQLPPGHSENPLPHPLLPAEIMQKDYAKNLIATPSSPFTEAMKINSTTLLHWLNQASTPFSLPLLRQKFQSWYAQMTIKNRFSETGREQKLVFRSLVRDAIIRGEREGTQWNITLPFNVSYQNNKGKITQLVNIDLTLGFKISSKFLPSQVAPIPTPTGMINQPQSAYKPLATNTIDCNYRIPSEITGIDEKIILSWAEKATVQSFNFNAATIDQELFQLQSCYTENGWINFKSALDKSGNIQAIKSSHLTMNSQIDGKVELVEAQANQWKIRLPLKVNWQSDKEVMTQLLTVDLTVGRKINGNLGIMQIIATINGSTLFKLNQSMNT